MDLLKYKDLEVKLDYDTREIIIRIMERDRTIRKFFGIDSIYCAPELIEEYTNCVFYSKPNECMRVIMIYDAIGNAVPDAIREIIEYACTS